MIHDYLPVCREDMDRRGWMRVTLSTSQVMPT